jgi:lipopolysaccharide transport protein LptA
MIRAVVFAVLLFGLSATTTRAQGSAPATLSRAAAASPAASATAAKAEKKEEAPEKKKKEGGIPGLENPKSNEPITTEIYADEASFDSAKYIGVFNGHVIVKDPRFNVQADKLTVFLHKGAEAGEEEGLERAIAEGNVGVVRDRPDPKGGPPQRAIGRADKAVYTSKDGSVELTGSPRVQQGVNSHIATSASTVMILNQSGELQTHGPSRTEIRQEPKPEPPKEEPKP